MKVVFVITGLVAGGAENMLLKLLQHGPRFENATVITLQGGGDLLPQYQAAGVDVESLQMNPRLPNPLAVFRLARRLRELRADVVSTWMYHADLIGGLAARLAGVPVAWGIRSSGADTDMTGWTTRAVIGMCGRLSGSVPDAILTCSFRARAIHMKIGYCAEKFAVIQNGFDLERFAPDHAARDSVRAELGLPREVPLVGVLARFSPQKNHQGFLSAAAQVSMVRPDVHFVLVGVNCDETNADLSALIQCAGLSGRVHCLGLRQDIPRLTAALDISCLSSLFGEAFPNVLGEALACGVPCVATDVGDSAAIIGDCGRVVAPGDDRGLAEAVLGILAMSDQDRQALGQRARERVLQEFEIRQIAGQYEKTFERLSLLRQRRLVK